MPTPPTSRDTDANRYLAPGWFTRNVFNRLVRFLTRRGVSLAGSRVLTVVGRRSGEPRSTVVNVLTLGGERYLVAPRGQTAWVKNVRASNEASLRVGRRDEAVTVTELADGDKLPVLRAYLAQWGWEVGQFFEGVKRDSDDATLLAVAPGFPVFRLAPA